MFIAFVLEYDTLYVNSCLRADVLKSLPNFNTAKVALKFGGEAWVLKKREEQRLEAAQMKVLRHLLGITKLDKEKNQCIGQKKKREHRT